MSDSPSWLLGARMAPSAHNTQPWRFTQEFDGRVVVRWDARRALPHSDPTDRDLYLSLGCGIESAVLKSAEAGTAMDFSPAPDDEDRVVGYLAPASSVRDTNDVLLAALMESRQTARKPHLRRPVSPILIEKLRAEAERWQCRLLVTTEQSTIHRLAALSRSATAALYADSPVHEELWQWLRLNPDSPDYQRDGLTADCLEIRGMALVAARAALPPSRMRMLVKLGINHVLSIDTQRVVRRSAAICLLTAPSDRRTDRIAAGRALLRLWLLAAEEHMSTHPVSALLDCPDTVAPTMDLFGAQGESPASVFRLGACPPVARSPRLPPNELLEAAR
ncbi:MAG: nitroreductase family protein [Chloroflexota bacterium]